MGDSLEASGSWPGTAAKATSPPDLVIEKLRKCPILGQGLEDYTSTWSGSVSVVQPSKKVATGGVLPRKKPRCLPPKRPH
jgi:hypothetical protein